MAKYDKLNNAPFADQYNVHTVCTDVYMMCEVPASVNVYRAACSLSDAD